MNKTTLTIIGFLLLMLGVISLVLTLVGVQLSYLLWIDAMGKGIGFVLRLIMVLTGVVMIVLSRGRFDGETMDY